MRFSHAPGLQVNILVDDVPLEELENNEEQNEPGRTVRYVQSTAGKNFAIEVLTEHGFELKDALLYSLYVDGKYIDGRVYNTAHIGRPYQMGGIAVCNESGEWTEEQFMFTTLQMDDAHPTVSPVNAYKDLGTVEVKFRHVKRVGEAQPRVAQARPDLGADKIIEKGLKGRAISNQTALGGSKPATTQTTIALEYPYGPAFAAGVFRYRCRKDLQIEGLIPRSPSPVPLEDRNPDDLSPEEARELIRRLRQQQTVTAKTEIKAEKRDHAQVDDDGNDGDIEVVSSISKRARIVEESGIEILDLTDD